MRFFIFIIFTLVITSSCNGNKEKLPIERDKLVDVLVDVHIAEAVLQEYTLQAKDSIGKAYYQKIYELHKVDEKAFNKSMYLIRQNPAAMESLYKDVLAEIERREKGQ